MKPTEPIASTFEEYLFQNNRDGSGKASSYLRALELLSPILRSKGGRFQTCADILAITAPDLIKELYDFVLAQQKLGENGIFAGENPMSYWRDRYFSAALSAYRKFLLLPEQRVIHHALQAFSKAEDEGQSSPIFELEQDEVFERFISSGELSGQLGKGLEKLRLQKTRVNQSIFRRIVLLNYQRRCCLTGLDIPDVLRASHILPWAEYSEHRMNPSNGICLSATYDCAFDRHMITFDEKYRLVIGKSIREHYSSESVKTFFISKEGQAIETPRKFKPHVDFLKQHREALR